MSIELLRHGFSLISGNIHTRCITEVLSLAYNALYFACDSVARGIFAHIIARVGDMSVNVIADVRINSSMHDGLVVCSLIAHVLVLQVLS